MSNKIHSFIEMLKRGYSKNLIIEGRAGIGKTHSVLTELEGESFFVIRGYSTPLRFYELLYENNDKDYIVIDDVEGLFNNKITKGLLKCCLELENRFVQYNSTTINADKLPTQFPFKPKVIVCCNSLPNDIDFRAVIDRCSHYIFTISNQELLNEIELLLPQPYKNTTLQDRQAVFNVLKSSIKEYHSNFSYRFFYKCLEAHSFDKKNWKDLVFNDLKVNEMAKFILFLDRSKKSIKEQYNKFYDKTGKSYRQFLRLRKKLGLYKYCR